MTSRRSAGRGGGGDAKGAANPRAVDFRRQLDTHTRTLLESFGALLRYAKVTTPQSTTQENFQINIATASLATAGEGLLRQIREVKLAVMLQDKEAMDCEVEQSLANIAQEREQLEKELEALSNELKAAYARAVTGEGADGGVTAGTEDDTGVATGGETGGNSSSDAGVAETESRSGAGGGGGPTEE